MLMGFGHIGLNCSNIDKSVAFYRDLLGLTQTRRVETATGNTIVFMDAKGGELELFGYTTPVATPTFETPRNMAGFRHIALRVDDVQGMYDSLSAQGIEFTGPPRAAQVNSLALKLAFCKDPDGIVVELMEYKD